jgi:hypothetical protein
VSTVIPVSCQDSELQSVVSGDVHFSEDFDSKSLKKMDNTRVEDLSMSSLSAKTNSRQSKFNKQIKESINANKNAKIDLPSHANTDLRIHSQNKNAEHESHHKKNQMPISESDPQQFFEILSSKLNKALEEQESTNKPLRVKSYSNSHLTNYENYEEQNEYEEVYDCDEDDQELDADDTDQLNNKKNENLNSFKFFNNSNLLKNTDSHSIDVQLEEHIDRVYNNNTNEYDHTQGDSHNQNLQSSSKMCIKATSNKKCALKSNNNLSLSSKLTASHIQHHQHHHHHNHNTSTNDNTSQNQHHFYKLTSTSKEVDIDSQSYSFQNKSCKKNVHNESSNLDCTKTNKNVNNTSKNVKDVSLNNHHGKDHKTVNNHSDTKTYERVSDWLNSGSQHPQDQQTINKKSDTDNLKKDVSSNENCNVKTTVAYYLPGEDLAYISTYNGRNLTLHQFKQLITKKGNFRYFFKTTSDLLGDECVVYQEANDENSNVPMFNNKVIAKIEKIIN